MLKDLIKKLEDLEQITEEIDARFEENPEDEEIEKAWDEAYKNEYAAAAEVVSYIRKLTGIDNGTARKMVAQYREQLKEIAEKE